MSKKEARIRKLLLATAGTSLHTTNHHAALLLRRGTILGRGHNYSTTHAEVDAIQAAQDNGYSGSIQGSTLHTLRVKAKSGRLGEGTPCAECMQYIKSWGIRRVVVYL